MAKKDWVWQPHAGHYILGDRCKFVLNTYLGNGYLVSTVGELWSDRAIREIHASIFDKEWHRENKHLKGSRYDNAYFKRFGYEEIGAGRKYETMVFKAKKSPEIVGCCEYEMSEPTDLDFDSYDSAKEARLGHMELCSRWSRKHGIRNKE